MASLAAIKSTIVRATFKTLDLVAPSVGAAISERLWFRIPTGLPLAEPTGRQFEVRWQGRTIRGQVWGKGPTVYLEHGWGGHGDQMLGFVDPLVAAGYQVVAHDAPSHGRSDPGRHGPRSTDAVEFGQALDAVAAEFGPAHAVIAHSLGSLATLLALRDGWFTAERLVLIAPVEGVPTFTGAFRGVLGFGDRTQRHADRRTKERTGYEPAELDTRALAVQLDRPELLIVQDQRDRVVGTVAAKTLAATWPGAEYVETNGLGHNRVLADPGVIGAVTEFVHFGEIVRESQAPEPGRVAS